MELGPFAVVVAADTLGCLSSASLSKSTPICPSGRHYLCPGENDPVRKCCMSLFYIAELGFMGKKTIDETI